MHKVIIDRVNCIREGKMRFRYRFLIIVCPLLVASIICFLIAFYFPELEWYVGNILFGFAIMFFVAFVIAFGYLAQAYWHAW